MNFVLGSGPASISAASALASRGLPVTILDVGRTLEPQRKSVLDRLSRQEPEQWDARDLELLRGGDQKAREGSIHVKLSYGSEYPYSNPAIPLTGSHPGFHYSSARGGLSNVWGASLLPFLDKDIADWPVRAADLAPHYREVLDFVPSTAVRDELEEILPTFTKRDDPLKPSQQATEFLNDLRARKRGLARARIHFGQSRMAVTASGDETHHPCVYRGLCLYGCPYSLIYSTAQTLDKLLARNAVRYIKDHAVERIEQRNGTVTIFARDLSKNEAVKFEAARVFVGCGILPTAHIVLNSLGLFDREITMLDSQYFIYPFFRLSRTPCVEKELLHSLAQLFMEIDDPRVSRHLVHMEIFSYSDFLKRALEQTALGIFFKSRFLADQILGRLLVFQCFLHSDDSSRMRVVLRKNENGVPQLHVTGERNFHSFWTSIKAGLKLTANALRLRGMPVVPAIQFAEPGRSYHSGGSFPMRKNPNELETDALGRLPAWDRVHLVDASVFPSIPATTITLGVMANAHRIATQSAEL